MKRLYLLRHAHTLPAGQGGDMQRALSPGGVEDAKTLAQAMQHKNYAPGLVYCSPAIRTRQTLEHVTRDTQQNAEFHEIIYTGNKSALLDLIHAAPESGEALMIVGHNPVIHETAARLTEDNASNLVQLLSSGYPPAALAVFDCPCASWRDVSWQSNRLIDLILPADA